MSLTKKILTILASRWMVFIWAIIITLAAVLDLIFHILLKFTHSIWFILILFFMIFFILACIFYKTRVGKYFPGIILKLIERDEDVVYFLSIYILSRGRSKNPEYLSRKYVKDIKHIMELSRDKLDLVDIEPLEILLGIKVEDIENIVSDYRRGIIDEEGMKTCIENEIKKIEEIIEE